LRDEQIVSLERHCMTILDLNRLKALAQKGSPPGAGFDHRVFKRADAEPRSAHLITADFQSARLPRLVASGEVFVT
jgi:hypothetical protein